MTDPLDQACQPDANTSDSDKARIGSERIHANALVSMRFELRWRSAHASHYDCTAAGQLNLARDPFPPELEMAVMDKPVGYCASHRFNPGELLRPYRQDRLLELRPEQFDSGSRASIQPRTGRFYPQSLVPELNDLCDRQPTPFRVTCADATQLQVDLNHPLADQPVELSLCIDWIGSKTDKRGGCCTEIADLVTADGPGMQGRWRGIPTDFFSDLPFLRADSRPDNLFYAQPRLVDHIDRTAIGEISALYGRLLPAGARVLDLMSSWHSHLPSTLALASVTGLGMNREELDANPMLDERVVQDLNQDSTLPFDDAVFDAVICTVSVEYLTDPVGVFRQLARVLIPGGLLIMTFSNRWFPPKVIRIWEAIHEYERPGLVLEYFIASGQFVDLTSWSLRGLPRPADDIYAGRLAFSDPVYAVWGRRAATAGDAA
ncbi:MAG TPA: class I SAM-dependent methyltransferase [Chromatiaceae bacterium]|jgi:SAM-dependent methyltransferase|nr:MAG: hypothetical protein N838_11400 [Thiohalocapsa sp. PB-PSB1]QQO54822.1 MAG: class I SAM-dependent methyltransferase [Thiohalocapsa sp. PB-PSB1]HBG97114.1 class I SAM-dependent methyltransferase [Chromatiaceae bacterium]HCS91071.1 class I SAM-dependent methyltransferase [Chromatiaceae bacterium]